VPLISNEYCSLWLNRDGSAARLSEYFWPLFLGSNNTTENRRKWAARYLAQMTEILRHSRARLGVHHFVFLTFSDSSRAWTGDNFISLVGPDGPVFEPNVLKYVPDSFAPVSVMIKLWDQPTFAPNSTIEVPVSMINDLHEKWSGEVTLEIRSNDKTISKQNINVELASLGKSIVKFNLKLPIQEGSYELIASIKLKNKQVLTHRTLHIKQ